MAIGLGIDTGGTYTDGVLYDFDSGRVIACDKRLTTPHDLAEGIEALLGALPAEILQQVTLVSLSTTLATNACVENVGARTALVTMGFDPVIVERVAHEYGLGGATMVPVSGSHGQQGQALIEPDYDEIIEKLAPLKGQIDAVGIVEYWGVRNPAYEKEAKRRIRAATGLPVAAAHELSAEINSMRRAATTLLNARLIPVIEKLMRAVEQVLLQYGVNAQLCVVRGDGTVMSQSYARECPVETLLSGPAASVMGAMRLTGEPDLIAVDIGGTTTDLALVRSGATQLVSEGVSVGDWRTGTRAIEVRTVALGGDTEIGISPRATLALGTRRALPLCALAAREPHVKAELQAMVEDEKEAGFSRGVFYTLREMPSDTSDLTDEENRMLALLSQHAYSVEALARAMGTRPYFMHPQRLIERGIILPSALTPTDIMHIRGQYTVWDVEASRLGVTLLAHQLGMKGEALMEGAMDMASERLYRLIVNFLLSRMSKNPPREPETMGLAYRPKGDELMVRMTTPLPLAAIGAPAKVMTVHAAQRLEAPILPLEHAGVAGAVGAITGSVVAEETAHIKVQYETYGITGYSVHTSAEYRLFDTLRDAQRYASDTVRDLARRTALNMGAQDAEVTLTRKVSQGDTAGGAGALLLGMWVSARALGRLAIVKPDEVFAGE